MASLGKDKPIPEIHTTQDIQMLIREAVLLGAMLADSKLRTQISPAAFYFEASKRAAIEFAKNPKEVDKNTIRDYLKDIGIKWDNTRVLNAIYAFQAEAASHRRATYAARDELFRALLPGRPLKDTVDAIRKSFHPDIVARLQLDELPPLGKPGTAPDLQGK